MVITEYKKRNLSILPNLFLCNLYMCKEYDSSFEELIKSQNENIDKYYPNINFNALYYNELKNMWLKNKAFL